MNDDEIESTPIAGRDDFAAALSASIAHAIEHNTRELWWCDPDYAQWPLNDAALLDLLTRWARPPQRRLTMLASRFEELRLHQPRFAEWRRIWGHALDCRVVNDVDASEVPTLVLGGDGRGIRIVDRQHQRGRAFRDGGEWRTWHEVFDALSQRSEPGFSATTLGL